MLSEKRLDKSNLIELFSTDCRLTKGNLQIIACAGAGKTEFVSTRIAYIIATGLALPENIVAFTFTERAAKELKFRIRSKVKNLIGHQADIGSLYIGTIHSFCYEILKEFFPEYRSFDVLNEGKRFAFVSSLQRDLRYDELKKYLICYRSKPYGSNEQTWVLNSLIRSIDIAREELRDFGSVSNCEAFIKAAERYESQMLERQFIDFSSMMSLCVEKLKSNPEILNEVRKKYSYITVDEYQDVNKIQEELIKLLTCNNSSICVVGDDDQSIYQFRGSVIDNIIDFENRYNAVHKHHLHINYRSSEQIISMSNGLISLNKKRLVKKMNSSGKEHQPGDIYKLQFYQQEDEAQFIANKIKELIGHEWIDKNGNKRGLSYSDIAIFFRSVRFDGKIYIEALERAGIPYAVTGIGGLFEASEVDVVFSVFSYLGDFGKIWDSDERISYIPSAENIYREAQRVFELNDKKGFIPQLAQLKEALKDKHRISLQSVYRDILVILGVANKSIHSNENEIILYNLGKLSQAVADYETTRTYCTVNDIKDFCWYIVNYAQGSYDAGACDDPTRVINAVQIMTLHGTKGLGFPAVFMPYCIERQQRNTDSGFLDERQFDFQRYKGSEEDERRLFYVGITRAMKYLYLTTCQRTLVHKRDKIPLQFFYEVATNHCIVQSKPDPTRRNKLKPQPSTEEYQFVTSYTELSDYLRCEYDYKMRYIYGFNPIVVQALGYGNQIHNLLNQLHKIAQNENRVPSAQEVEDLIDKSFYLRYAAREQNETLKESAKRSLLKYLNIWREDFILSLKTECAFEIEFDNALLAGSIDLIKRQSTSENVLEIIDFKTGSERSLEDEIKLQVQLYTYAARQALKFDIQKAQIHFMDDNKQNRVEVPCTEDYTKDVVTVVNKSINNINMRQFRRNPKDNRTCKGCDWNKICPQG